MTLAPLADVHAACWIDRERPTTADQLPIADVRVAGVRAAARAMNDILERNAAIRGLPEVRLRSTWQVVRHPRSAPWTPYGFHLVLWAHPRQAWGPGDCDVSPNADRDIAEVNARAGQYDDSGPRQVYEAMKKTDPAEAEKFWAMIQGVKAQAAQDAAAAATAPPIVNAYVKQLDDLRASRASLTPAQLQAQAREGHTSKSPARPTTR